MAQKVVTTLTDDIDAASGIETEAAETIAFGFDGKNYVIDLSKENAVAFRENVGFFAGYARMTGGGTRSASRSKADRQNSALVRAWAKQHGHKVSDKGRIPESVQAEYDATH